MPLEIPDSTLSAASAAISGASALLGGLLTHAANRLAARRKAVLDEQRNALENKRLTAEERGEAFDEIMRVVTILRAEVERQGRELDDEREMRRRAEDQVRGLREELSLIRAAMRDQGITVAAYVPRVAGKVEGPLI